MLVTNISVLGFPRETDQCVCVCVCVYTHIYYTNWFTWVWRLKNPKICYFQAGSLENLFCNSVWVQNSENQEQRWPGVEDKCLSLSTYSKCAFPSRFCCSRALKRWDDAHTWQWWWFSLLSLQIQIIISWETPSQIHWEVTFY